MIVEMMTTPAQRTTDQRRTIMIIALIILEMRDTNGHTR